MAVTHCQVADVEWIKKKLKVSRLLRLFKLCEFMNQVPFPVFMVRAKGMDFFDAT